MGGEGLMVCKRADGDPAHIARPATRPGPYCATCRRVVTAERKEAAWARDLWQTYGITPEQYRSILTAQGERCYVCQRAVGKVKRLAVDHDHVLAATHPHPVEDGCPECIRGLACGWCNQEVLGRLGGNPATYDRIADALRNPPARRVLAEPWTAPIKGNVEVR